MERSAKLHNVIVGVAVATAWITTAHVGQAVEMANIVAPNGVPAGAISLTIDPGQGTPDFFLESGAVTGLYPVRIGPSATDDFAGGVMITSVRESDGDSDGLVTFYQISSITSTPTQSAGAPDGTLKLVVDARAGTATIPANADLAAAYFPYSEQWKGGTLRATANGAAPNSTSTFGNGVTIADVSFSAIEGGVSTVKIPGVTDSRQQGLLFVNHSKNEDNYASVAPNPTGEHWVVGVHNGGNAGAPEADPFAFVYVPYGTPNVTMASIHGASGPTQAPTVMQKSGADFTFVREGTGTYRLSIAGQTPTSGVLLMNTGGQISTSETSVSQNVLTYKADGDSWIVQTRDYGSNAPLDAFLETPLAERSQSLQFAFMPFANRPTGPGPNPTPFNLKDKILGFHLQETEVDASMQASPSNYGTITAATAGYRIEHLRQDRGDNSIAVNGFFPAANDGMWFGAISQGFRDNTTLPNNPSGQAAYGMITAADSGGGWEFHTHTADPQTAAASLQEFNVNFSGVFFGLDTPFQKAQNQALSSNTLGVSLPGVNTLNDGILVTQASGNFDHFAVATPASDGSNWTIHNYKNETTAPLPADVNAVNWIYLPYASDNLVAGRVAADGTVLKSTGIGANPGEFTLSKEAGSGVYLLTIAGKTPTDGALLLTAEATAGVEDNLLVYEAAGDAFRILGVDQVTAAEREASIRPLLEDTSFTFAFIDFDEAPTPGSAFLSADFNNDGAVNGVDLAEWRTDFGKATGAVKGDGDADADGDVDGRDFLNWQSQFGSPAATAAGAGVPEPGAGALALAALSGTLLVGRRRIA